MSIERELLKRFMIELTTEEDVVSLFNDIKECLAQPEQDPEEGVRQKLLRIEDGIEVEILPSELWLEGYEVGKRIMQPKQEPEAWILEDKKTGFRRQSAYKPTDLDEETCNVIPLYTAPPKREPLSDAQIAELWGDKHSGKTYMVKNFARAIEKECGIRGGE